MSRANVSVSGKPIAEIGEGIVVFLGVGVGDGRAEADQIAQKLSTLRIFDDGQGRMNEPLGEREVLCISQFTLNADTRKGNRPSFAKAAPAELAEPLYQRVCERLGAKQGAFGARMAVELVNDGPVTLLLEA